ncbi:hypothetical protein BDR26DRAFT_942519 [Obelidium mucronatum]|nr:hypothetical protein BDR26DRAFT_942519 [Obelidium mucronatum]
MTVAFANLWLKNVPSVILNAYHSAFPSVSSDTEQYSGIPSAGSSSIFKRAYYLYQMLLLQEYIQDPAVQRRFKQLMKILIIAASNHLGGRRADGCFRIPYILESTQAIKCLIM